MVFPNRFELNSTLLVYFIFSFPFCQKFHTSFPLTKLEDKQTGYSITVIEKLKSLLIGIERTFLSSDLLFY